MPSKGIVYNRTYDVFVLGTLSNANALFGASQSVKIGNVFDGIVAVF